MWLYNKTFAHQNREGKITALASLLFGGLFYGFGCSDMLPVPVIFQLVGVCLIVCSVFIASRYLLREYKVAIIKNDSDNDDARDTYDLVVCERKGKREPKVCHIGLNTIKSVKIVTKESLKAQRKEKLDGFRYIYDTRFIWNERIEITAMTGDYYSIIYLAYDDALSKVLNENI